MNRPLMITAAGVVVVLVAIGANFLLWQQEMSEEPLTEQASAPQAAAKAAAEAAAKAAERAREAAAKAAAAQRAADEAVAKAEAPDAATDIKDAATKARAHAMVAEEEARQAATAAETAKAVAEAASQAARMGGKPASTTGQPAQPGQAALSPATGPVRPSFDVVRINPKGDTVMAGRAAPDSKVRILDRGKLIGEATADKRGEWVFVPETPLPPGTSELTLESDAGGTKMVSDSAVMLLVPEKGKDISGQPTDQPQQPLALKVPAGQSEKVTVPDTPIPSVVLQKPTTGESASSLTVDAIDYDDAGRLSISGHADKGALVQLYLDNKFLGRATADADGRWSITPDARVEPGLYTLRVDQVDAAGKVLARVPLPFSRAEPLSPGAGRYVIVQPGNSLWRIARRTYGTGFKYTMIFGANAEQIADPDLIYPGQIFALPPGN